MWNRCKELPVLSKEGLSVRTNDRSKINGNRIDGRHMKDRHHRVNYDDCEAYEGCDDDSRRQTLFHLRGPLYGELRQCRDAETGMEVVYWSKIASILTLLWLSPGIRLSVPAKKTELSPIAFATAPTTALTTAGAYCRATAGP